ncbi:uncharacterized protein PAC_17453 [Phialocephala subalpina]|uniref:Uncharacterized protein n=1 Tax=Phialocephala subalpina TaxID=576137 RepID=A0A1L7XR87_9HELO|nr:uncharacterized protein PAC_17453 [Phialocephala subalpina]
MATTIMDDYQSSLGELQDTQLATTTTARTPGPCSKHSCAGFVTVTTLLGVHLVCVMAITALYLRQARYSRYGNVLHTAAQLMSDDLREIFQQADSKGDKEELERDGKDDFVKVAKSRFDGKIEVVRLARDDGSASDLGSVIDVEASRMTRFKRKIGLKKDEKVDE